jgi:hypothetical protein
MWGLVKSTEKFKASQIANLLRLAFVDVTGHPCRNLEDCGVETFYSDEDGRPHAGRASAGT